MASGNFFITGDLVQRQGKHVLSTTIEATIPMSDESDAIAVIKIGLPAQMEQGFIAIELQQARFMERLAFQNAHSLAFRFPQDRDILCQLKHGSSLLRPGTKIERFAMQPWIFC